MKKLTQDPREIVQEALATEAKMKGPELVKFIKDQIGVDFEWDSSVKSRKYINLITNDGPNFQSSKLDKLRKLIPNQSIINRVEDNGVGKVAVFLNK